MEIKNVIIFGLGAMGVTYACMLKNSCNLFVLADSERIEKYKKTQFYFNNNPVSFNYITPEESFNADLIIISTKYDGFESAIKSIKNFVSDNTIIISIMNGISGEKLLSEKYGYDKILHSYYIGPSAIKFDNKITHTGNGKIVFGSPFQENKDKINSLKTFFDRAGIGYEIPNNIMYSRWLKYTFNILVNQVTAICNISFKDIKQNVRSGGKFLDLAKKIINEVKQIAEKEGVKGLENLEKDAIGYLDLMADDGKTSMLQDILSKRKTEVDIFAGEIIKLGKYYNIPTPYNQVMYDMIKVLEEV